jgi:CheY-like chemotaxis protein
MTTTAPVRVLVIDDLSDMLTITSALLQSVGAEPHTAGSAAEALELVERMEMQKKPIHLILLDIHMPGVDGYATAQQLRGTGFKGKIIAITANATMEGKKKSKEAGIDSYLSKLVLNKEVLKALLDEVRRAEAVKI